MQEGFEVVGSSQNKPILWIVGFLPLKRTRIFCHSDAMALWNPSKHTRISKELEGLIVMTLHMHIFQCCWILQGMSYLYTYKNEYMYAFVCARCLCACVHIHAPINVNMWVSTCMCLSIYWYASVRIDVFVRLLPAYARLERAHPQPSHASSRTRAQGEAQPSGSSCKEIPSQLPPSPPAGAGVTRGAVLVSDLISAPHMMHESLKHFKLLSVCVYVFVIGGYDV